MLRTTALLVTAALAALPVVASGAGEVIASGSILIGGPHTELVGSLAELGGPDGVDGFSFDATPWVGFTVRTETQGTDHDIDLWFRDSAGNYVPKDDPGFCATSAVDELCTIPADAATAYVVAFSGRQLEVQVLNVSAPPLP